MNEIHLVSNIFSVDQLNKINISINDLLNNIKDTKLNEQNGNGINTHLGRMQIGNISKNLNSEILDVVTTIAKSIQNKSIDLHHALYVEYNNKFGQPKLPPHYDHDNCDLIINYQLSSNTEWDIGLNTELYSLKDNAALIFNGNIYPHWRPHKEFKDNEYIKMIFFRFYNSKNPSDYSHLGFYPDDNHFDKINKIRGKHDIS